MASWKEVFQRGREVTRSLKRKGTQTAQYNGKNNTSITGWKLHNLFGISLETERFGNHSADYKETWGDKYLVLGIDGVIYECVLLKEEYGPGMSGTGQVRIDENLSVYRMNPRITQSRSYRQKISTDEVMEALNRLNG